MSANIWKGLELPDGLSVEKAEQAAKMIDDYERSDFLPEGEVLSLAELVIELHRVLSGIS